MKTLEDIRRDKDLQSKSHWDIKPRERVRRTRIETEEEMAQIEKQLQARVGYYFYIDVRNLQPVLYLYENYPDGSGRFVAEITKIPEEMLHEAAREAGRKIETDRHYYLNTAIQTWLKKQVAD